ncbi:MAG: hypothetical protein AVDCRST_MAG67-2444 [uncultured Solirubrobacteraceae bacterium]|uniref:Uncharacterized protein n=1 Tax=uncultured Solirubrobacteraceae bacterium TaxID=1162706 RepID=A0A6J4SV44_9ACTN|nr:MAG: hypothetical protein AVDCRST_MAG67-2444 [uncultured Solirubrobacteraceae bacterium]
MLAVEDPIPHASVSGRWLTKHPEDTSDEPLREAEALSSGSDAVRNSRLDLQGVRGRCVET